MKIKLRTQGVEHPGVDPVPRVRLAALQGANRVLVLIDVPKIKRKEKSKLHYKTLCRLYISIMFQDPDSIRCFPGPE